MQHFLGFAHEKALISHVLQNQGMGGEGLLHQDATTCEANDLEHSQHQGEAFSEAIWSTLEESSCSAPFDRLHLALGNVDLQSIVLAWADLPVDTINRIMAVVQADPGYISLAAPGVCRPSINGVIP